MKQSNCEGLTPEEARKHAERLIQPLFLVGCVPVDRMSTAASELGYGLLNIFGRAELPRQASQEPRSAPSLTEDSVEWIVNDIAELGVKIGDRFFFLYKGESLEYHGGHDDGSPMRWRPVYKREFGEVCHPEEFYKFGGEGWKACHAGDEWREIPRAAAEPELSIDPAAGGARYVRYEPPVGPEHTDFLAMDEGELCPKHAPKGPPFGCTRKVGHDDDCAAHTSPSDMVARWRRTPADNAEPDPTIKHLYLDTTAPNPARRAHWAWVRRGGPDGEGLLPIRLDADQTVTEERTSDEQHQARVKLAQELVDAWNWRQGANNCLADERSMGSVLERVRAYTARLIREIEIAEALARAHGEVRPDLIVQLGDLRAILRLAEEPHGPTASPSGLTPEEARKQEDAAGYRRDFENLRELKGRADLAVQDWRSRAEQAEARCDALDLDETLLGITAAELVARERDRCLALIANAIEEMVPGDQWQPEWKHQAVRRLDRLSKAIREEVTP